MASKQYPDTRQGAIDCLKEESTYDLTNLKGVFHDDWVEGVWAVDLQDGVRVIVYLKGYGLRKDATYNDFESNE